MTRSPRIARLVLTSAVSALLAVLPSVPQAAGRGGVRTSKHGLVQRRRDAPAGACIQCHDRGHRRDVGSADPNALCVECHRNPLPGSSFQGNVAYGQSAHGGPGGAVWPGPKPRARPATDAGECVNCHDPHGAMDGSGKIDSMLIARGEALCLACHSAGARTDVATQLRKAYRHGSASKGSAAAGECAACHNPHLVRSDSRAPRGPQASGRLGGVARVRVTNGAAGSAPAYTAVDATDPGATLEYEICFRCHSGWARGRPVGSPDFAILFNPANASFHPVEAAGRNLSVDFRSFANGWSPDRLVLCTDCHGSDDSTTRGLHGSNERHLLQARYVAGPGLQQSVPTDLCFRCHAWATYADPAGGAAWSYSRFRLHASHAVAGAGCFGCHDSHGSATAPALIATLRGIATFAQSTTGGTCVATCHVRSPPLATYTVAYPR